MRDQFARGASDSSPGEAAQRHTARFLACFQKEIPAAGQYVYSSDRVVCGPSEGGSDHQQPSTATLGADSRRTLLIAVLSYEQTQGQGEKPAD